MRSKAVQDKHMACLIQLLELCFVAWNTAESDINRNTKSNERHQVGDATQHDVEQACAKNRKGVAIQCIMHSALEIIPMISFSVFNSSTSLFIMCNIVANITIKPLAQRCCIRAERVHVLTASKDSSLLSAVNSQGLGYLYNS